MKKVGVAYFNLLSGHLCGRTEENHETTAIQPSYLLFDIRKGHLLNTDNR